MINNKINVLFDNANGNTIDLKKEASELTGIHIRTIQRLYSDRSASTSIPNFVKLRDFFSLKMGTEISLDEIVRYDNKDVNKSVSKMINKLNNENN